MVRNFFVFGPLGGPGNVLCGSMWGRAFILLPRAGCDAPCSCAGSSAWGRVTLGALPLKPRQEPEVPAPPAFYSKPCRPPCSSARSARTLRVSSVRCGAGARATSGGSAPYNPCQGTEFPGPSALGRSGVQLTALLPQRALIQQIRIKREHRAVLLRMGAQRQFHHLINQLRIR